MYMPPLTKKHEQNNRNEHLLYQAQNKSSLTLRVLLYKKRSRRIKPKTTKFQSNGKCVVQKSYQAHAVQRSLVNFYICTIVNLIAVMGVE